LPIICISLLILRISSSFNDMTTTLIYTLSLHDALPILDVIINHNTISHDYWLIYFICQKCFEISTLKEVLKWKIINHIYKNCTKRMIWLLNNLDRMRWNTMFQSLID